ncbi:hypothetical protein [Streptomyces sp. Rer75]|nr:hypothetical protein [Streptomyces sp. Rer75]QLH24764.1 hypothetical protein HYQ63_32340 [Streptomyces sp. Rer75]
MSSSARSFFVVVATAAVLVVSLATVAESDQWMWLTHMSAGHQVAA